MNRDIAAVHRALEHLPREERAPPIARAWAALALGEARRRGLEAERIVAGPFRSVTLIFDVAGAGTVPHQAALRFDELGGICAVVGGARGCEGDVVWHVEQTAPSLRECIGEILRFRDAGAS